MVVTYNGGIECENAMWFILGKREVMLRISDNQIRSGQSLSHIRLFATP